ncbi:class I SAM-dependent methyltransferase [Amorphus coralli]|uniref:class I SAM-dependent methyltransferase n=1 Tax=Amorphus coralli TaxID=340680 RepID=UPI00035DA355|nr:class I SAM-dependent methyltransferase [Amorphus coralli]
MPRDSEAFWDKVSAKYAARPVSDPASYEHTLERTRAYLSADDRVLELGCGTGTTALKLAGDVAHITASDISSEMLAIGARKAAEAGADTVDFLHADIHKAAAAGATYDAVLAFNLFHLTEDLPESLAAAASLVKPGGHLISKTACLAGKPLIGVLVAAMGLVGKAPKVTFVSIEELDRQISAAGLEIVETGVFPKSPPARFVVARKPG